MEFLKKLFGWNKGKQGGASAKGKSAALKTTPVTTPVTATDELTPDLRLAHRVRLQFYDLAFEQAGSSLATISDFDRSLMDEAVAQLQKPEDLARAVPRLPSVIPQLIKSLRDPNSSAKKYADLIKLDPALASSILNMVNTTYYNPTNRKVSSFQNAVVMLGQDGLRTLLSRALMQPILRRNTASLVHFSNMIWAHSVDSALSCQLLSESYPVEPYKAYLTGLVHDIGSITLLTVFTQHYQKSTGIDQPPVHCIIKLFEEHGNRLSCEIAKFWQLPDDVQQAMEEQKELNATASDLGRILFTSNFLCELYALLKHDFISAEQAARAMKATNAPISIFKQLDTLHEPVVAH
ncbi:HDOD domain-containing protein [Reinekea marinisedimentorum]|uniref:HD-like signal output (HDOD) protein n=1 Tax=Reinekea marinisedimentorum TaxID=230495 RepID=A0A4R3I027_9GAMM|nr:HDOD domain-containing protein [Reinekea marinisedimentorum]TCS38868.1 HD-like signal output (HDOD) protein [Reinekea marinisedimentorum]